MPKTRPQGFTLIEMSIVLVIIGLIVGGVLVGQDLIRAAGVRATVAQIEKYNTAVNTFRGKYGALPGDIADPAASSFGFIARGTSPGQGDGNGILEGYEFGNHYGDWEGEGETIVFWRDLSTAQLIDGGFNTASPTSAMTNPTSGTSLELYFPTARLGGGNYIYVWSGGLALDTGAGESDGQNYFELAGINSIAAGYEVNSYPALTVAQAQAIDQKIDDGLPQSGNVIAVLVYTNGAYSTGQDVQFVAGGTSTTTCFGASTGFKGSGGPTTAVTPGSATTCYDNGGVGGAAQQYSLAQSNGAGVNCALSFRFQ